MIDDMEWISIKDEKPVYYKGVIIFDGETIHYNWHRIADEEGEYFVSLESDKIIESVTHWMPLPQIIVPNK